MAKFYDIIRWTIFILQLLYMLVAVGFFVEWFRYDEGLSLVISLFFFWCSFHFYWLSIVFDRQFVTGITDFSKNGMLGMYNRKIRRDVKREIKKKLDKIK